MNRKQNITDLRFSRRTLLKGAGVALALPWLESIPAFGSLPAASGIGTARNTPPQRLAVIFMANGISYNHWSATGEGAAMELSKTLAPLDPFKEKLNVISGLFNKAATGVGIHPGQTGNLLSGARLTKGAEVHGAISMDQVLANKFAEQTIAPSMVLGCEQPVTGYHESNFSMAYSSHISWQSETTPVPLEEYPARAWDMLFENKGSKRNQSILDRVKDQAAGLSKSVSSDDAKKLDEYLTSVRSVEKRIETTRELANKAADNAKDKGQPLVMMKRPDNGLPEDIREHMKLMLDIVALGFQTDKTRVVTAMLCRDISGLCYPFLNVTLPHHPCSHEDTGDAYERVCRYYITQYAYLVEKLSQMKEGEGTVLDNSCIMFMSNMWSGAKHDSSQVPILTAGGLGGTLKTGRVLDYYKKGDENRRLCSFYLSLMNKMGMGMKRFGDAEAELTNI